MKKQTPILIVALLLMVAIFSVVNVGATAESTKEKEVKALTARGPIYINSNSEFTAANGVSSGNGTAGNPYIIENWDINASTAHGIEIKNTDSVKPGSTSAYFIIRNCVIHDGKSNFKSGIYFYHVVNGGIDNVTSHNNHHGFYLDSPSNNNTITNNHIYNNNYGIYLYGSSNNTITNCDIYNNYEDGIYLSSSPNNQITNCAVYKNDYGIYLQDSSSNNITNCNVHNNFAYGIYLFYFSSNNIITNCCVHNNTDYGVYLYSLSDNNFIYHNNLINNTPNADDRCTNFWCNMTLGEGNYWNDYIGSDTNNDGIGDTAYSIQGGSNSDNYPLMKMNGWETLGGKIITKVNSPPATLTKQSFVVDTIINNFEGFTSSGGVYIDYYLDDNTEPFCTKTIPSLGVGEESSIKSDQISFSTSGKHTITIKISSDSPDDYISTPEITFALEVVDKKPMPASGFGLNFEVIVLGAVTAAAIYVLKKKGGVKKNES